MALLAAFNYKYDVHMMRAITNVAEVEFLYLEHIGKIQPKSRRKPAVVHESLCSFSKVKKAAKTVFF